MAAAVIRDRNLATEAAPHEIGRLRQSANRPHDGARQIERQQDGDGEGNPDELEYRDTGIAHAGFDVAAIGRTA